MHYEVVVAHRSEYPEPITFARGALLKVGERYEGPEGWDDWYFCAAAGREGWVPAQVFERVGEGVGRALEDYTAREMEVGVGESVVGGRILGGWVWCCREGDSGWVPLECLRALD
ncbi:SH3 domain-containing protein [Pseudomonas citronellolis]|uniref:SH3 domain-containing protein n=1 Tax=Pseudomonas citronellolis TaxID=53408 RepID=UPI000E2EC5BE|nr:SH3 domain-containing protein [Pseudomonas citronellolis]